MKTKQKKLGISLRGGGAKCTGYLGLFKLLKELDIEVTYILGSSMGAMIAVLMAFEYELDECCERLKTYHVADFLSLKSISNLSLDTQKFIQWGESHIGAGLKIEDAKIPFAIQITNLTDVRNEIITSGIVSNIATASCSHPSFAIPMQINGKMYSDGDLTSGYDADYLKSQGCEVVIGLNSYLDKSQKDEFNLFDSKLTQPLSATRTALLSLDTKYAPPDLIIENYGQGFEAFDFPKAEAIYEQGYEISKQYEEKIKKMVERKWYEVF